MGQNGSKGRRSFLCRPLGGSASIWSRIVFTLVGLAALCGIPGLFTEETEE